jgi:hypothetical protein
MAENLKVTYYNNGYEIPTEYSNEEWTQLDTGSNAVFVGLFYLSVNHIKFTYLLKN